MGGWELSSNEYVMKGSRTKGDEPKGGASVRAVAATVEFYGELRENYDRDLKNPQ